MTATAESPVQAARFKGRRGPLAGLLLRNLLFSILTLGIYRFWGRTRVRRFVWRHTVALDDVLEYLGTGAELFVGFLIALVVLLPLFAGYSVLQFVFVDGPAFAVLDLLYYLLLFFLIQIAIYRMRRYRLTRTAWRGVRFGLGGSSLAYAGIAFGYGLLTLATLGLAYPWMRVATLRYFGRHAAFGTAAATLTPSARYLFARWLAVVAPLLAAAAIFVVLNREESEYVDSFLYAIDHIVFWPLAILPLIFLAWIWYRIVEFRHMLSNLKIGNTGFVSSVRASFVFWRVLIYFLVLVGGIGIFSVAIVLVIAASGMEGGIGFQFVPLLALVLYLPFLSMVKTLFLDIPLLGHACDTLGIWNAEALDRVVQSSASLPRYGEGAAEALDVGGF